MNPATRILTIDDVLAMPAGEEVACHSRRDQDREPARRGKLSPRPAKASSDPR
jgi:hypothetical protein